MKRRSKVLSRILSFTLVFVFLFSENSLSVAATGLNDDTNELVIISEETVGEEISDNEVIEEITEETDFEEISEKEDLEDISEEGSEDISEEDFEDFPEKNDFEEVLGDGSAYELSLNSNEISFDSGENVKWCSFTAQSDGDYLFYTAPSEYGSYMTDVYCDLYTSINGSSPIVLSRNHYGQLPSDENLKTGGFFWARKALKAGETIYLKADKTDVKYTYYSAYVYVSKLENCRNNQDVNLDSLKVKSAPYGFEASVGGEYQYGNAYLGNNNLAVAFSSTNDFSQLYNCFRFNYRYVWDFKFPENIGVCELNNSDYYSSGYIFSGYSADAKAFPAGSKLYYCLYTSSYDSNMNMYFLTPLSDIFETTAGEGVDKTSVTLGTPDVAGGYFGYYGEVEVNNPKNEKLAEYGYALSLDGKNPIGDYEEINDSHMDSNKIKLDGYSYPSVVDDYDSFYVSFYVKVREGQNASVKKITTSWCKIVKRDISHLADEFSMEVTPGTKSVSFIPKLQTQNKADKNRNYGVSYTLYKRGETNVVKNGTTYFYFNMNDYMALSSASIDGLTEETAYTIEFKIKDNSTEIWSKSFDFTTNKEIIYSESDIPDEALREALLGSSSSEIKRSELEKITTVSVSDIQSCGKTIKNLKGLDLCTNLQSVYIYYQDIEDISVLSNMTSLTSITIGSCNITKLPDLSKLTKLRNVSFYNNLIEKEEVTKSKFPAGIEDIDYVIAEIKNNQRKPVEVFAPEKFYMDDGKVKAFFGFSNVRSARRFDVVLTINDIEYTLEDVPAYTYCGGYYIFDAEDFKEGNRYNYSLVATENAGGQVIEKSGSFLVEEFKVYQSQQQYISPYDSQISIQSLKIPYEDVDSIECTVLDKNSNIVGEGKGSFSYDEYSLLENSSFEYSYYFSDYVGIKVNNIYANICLYRKITSGVYDLQLKYNGKTVLVEDAFAGGKDYISKIERIYVSVDYDNAGDYIYVQVDGSKLDYDDFNPVIEINGTAVTEYTSKIGNVFKLKKKSGFLYNVSADVKYISKGGIVYEVSDNAKLLYINGEPSVSSCVYNPKTQKFQIAFSSNFPMDKPIDICLGKGYNSSFYYNEWHCDEIICSYTIDKPQQYMEIDLYDNQGNKWKYPLGTYDSYFLGVTSKRDNSGYIASSTSVSYTYSGFTSQQGYSYYESSYLGNGYVFVNSTKYTDTYYTNVKVVENKEYTVNLYEDGECVDTQKVTMRTNKGSDYGYVDYSFTGHEFTADKEYYVEVCSEGMDPNAYSLSVLSKGKVYFSYQYCYISKYNEKDVIYVQYHSVGEGIDRSKIETKFYKANGEEITTMKLVGKEESGEYYYYTGWPEDEICIYAKSFYEGEEVRYFNEPQMSFYEASSYTNITAERGCYISLMGEIYFFTSTNVGYTGVNNTIDDKCTVNIRDDISGEVIDSINVNTSGAHFFTKTDLTNTLKKDPNLNKLYTLELLHDGLSNGYDMEKHCVIGLETVTNSEVKDVSISPSSLTLAKNETKQLTAIIEPEGVITALTWSSSDDSVATVTSDGYVTGLKNGKATITVQTSNGKKATCTVTVKTVPLSGVSLDVSNMIMNVGSSGTLNATIAPENCSDVDTVVYEWTSSDSSIVEVTKNECDGQANATALISAKGAGKATITVTAASEGVTKSASCYITVKAPVEKITIGEFEFNEFGMRVGDVYKIPVTVETAGSLELCQFEVSEYFENADTEQNISITDKIVSDGYVEIKCLRPGKSGITVKVDELEESIDFTIEDNIVELINSIDDSLIGKIYAVKGQALGKLPSAPLVDGYVFAGWSLRKDELKPVDEKTIFDNQWIIYANYIKNESKMVIAINKEQKYTGSAIKPAVTVMYGSSILTSKDVTVSYKNNTAAYTYSEGDEGFDPNKAPTVTVKGKGNYTGIYKTYFTIRKHSISDGDVTVDSSKMSAYRTGKVLKLKPVIKWGSKTLKENKDYTLTFTGDCIEPGTYKVTIEGCGSFEGTTETTMQILDKKTEKLVSKLTVSFKNSKEKKCKYTGEAITPEVVVKDGKKVLTQGEDYQVKYVDNILPGKGTIIVTGTNIGYSGSKKLSFTINGAPIKNARIAGVSNKAFTGSPVVLDDLTLSYKGVEEQLVSGTDYTVSYLNNVNAGTATVIIAGRGNYTGSVKKTFKITPMLAKDIEVADIEVPVTLVKSGCKPSIKATATLGTAVYTLKAGKDYTLSYKNNKAVADSTATKKPTVVATFKGNFKGKSAEKYFEIAPSPISELKNISVKDAIDNGKANNWYSKISVYDELGTALKAGTDYEVTYVLDEKNLTKADKVEVSETPVTITAVIKAIETTKKGAKGSYSGNMEISYRLWPKGTPSNDISKAKATIENIYYTGNGVVLKKTDFTAVELKVSKTESKQLVYGVDYEIVGYLKNTAKGKATVILKGKGDYSGTLKATFKIVSQPVYTTIYLES